MNPDEGHTRRFALPAFVAMITLSLPTVRAFGDDAAPPAPPVTVQSPPDSEVTKHHEERSNTEQRAADLQRQDSQLHSQLQSLIAQLGEELQLEIQSRPAPDVTEQQERQAARDAFKPTPRAARWNAMPDRQFPPSGSVKPISKSCDTQKKGRRLRDEGQPKWGNIQ